MPIMKPPSARPPEPLPESLGFRFRSGTTARSLPEFRDALRAASPDDVWFHREHVVPWVRDVLADAPLARRLEAYAQSGASPAMLREIYLDLVAARIEG